MSENNEEAPNTSVFTPPARPERRKRQRGMSLGYWATKFFCGMFFSIGFKTRIMGVKNLPKRGAFLLAANHTSYFDPPLISGLIPKPLHFFARKSLLKNTWFTVIYRDLNVIPVDNEGNDIGAVKTAIKTLKEHKPLVIFPEGTRSADGTLQRGQRGAGLIACRAQVPVVPVRIFGTYEALGRHTNKPTWKMPITMVVGKPLKPEEYDVGPSDKERYQKAVDKIMEAISYIEKPPKHIKSEADWIM